MEQEKNRTAESEETAESTDGEELVFSETTAHRHHHHHHHHHDDGTHSRSSSHSHAHSHSHTHSHSEPVSKETASDGEFSLRESTVPSSPKLREHKAHHRPPVSGGKGEDPGIFRTVETISGPAVQDSRKSLHASSSHGEKKKVLFPKLHKAYKRFLRKLHLKNWQFLLIVGLLIALIIFLIFMGRRPAHEHSFGEWVTVSEATCTEQGRQERRCACGATEEHVLPITHEFVYTGINPDSKSASESALTACRLCGMVGYAKITSAQLGLPIVWLDGIKGSVTKDENTAVSFVYEEGDLLIESAAEIHLQGASSASRPKKNYSLHLLDPDGTGHKVQLRESWGRQSKYCLKADYLDSSAVRNVVTAALYGEISADRGASDRYASLVNGGAVDGYPVAVYLNGRFAGSYSLNIPKNKWLFGMKENAETREAILYAREWTESTALRAEMKENLAASGWDLEFCSTEDDSAVGTGWVRESFNRLITFVNESDDVRFRAELHEYLNVDRAIDTMLLTLAIGGVDNLSKNILWTTYDGVHWACTPYDLDTTWGLSWRGRMFRADDIESSLMPPMNTGNHNLLWKRMWSCYRSEILERYAALRQGTLSEAHVLSLFEEHMALIPETVKEANRTRWPDEACPDSADPALLEAFVRENLAILDSHTGR